MREIQATDGQRVLWFMDHYQGGNGMMSVPLLFRMCGTVDSGALQGALHDLAARHDALRTTFRRQRGRLVQICHDERQIALETTEVPLARGSADDGALPGQFVRELLRADPDTAETVARATLVRLAPDDHLLILDIHHLVTDAWSNRLIARDLAAFYNRRRGLAGSELPPVAWQQPDYAQWQAERLDGAVLRGHQDFWKEYLSGARYPDIPSAARTGMQRPLAANEWFSLEPRVLDGLAAVAKEERTTRFVVLLAIFFAVLMEITGDTDITLASILANRTRRETLETVGYLANMVPIRARAAEGSHHRELIRDVRKSVLRVMEHQELPYLTLPMDPDTAPAGRLEDVVFHMLAVPPTAELRGPVFAGLRTTALPIPDGLGSRFDLELLVFPGEPAFSGVFRYAEDRFDQAYVQALRERYLGMAQTMAASAPGSLARLSTTSPTARAAPAPARIVPRPSGTARAWISRAAARPPARPARAPRTAAATSRRLVGSSPAPPRPACSTLPAPRTPAQSVPALPAGMPPRSQGQRLPVLVRQDDLHR